jgi:hypothetical protein
MQSKVMQEMHCFSIPLSPVILFDRKIERGIASTLHNRRYQIFPTVSGRRKFLEQHVDHS